MLRHDGRQKNELRKITIETNLLKYPEGSVLLSAGDTKVLCSATIEEKVPPFLRGKGTGWITAEYSMLPGATQTRTMRESIKGKLNGRTMEIQRLIGRALRSVVDLEQLGERTIWVDCDVIQADGGTRTASITGAFLAMKLAIRKLLRQEKLKADPVKEHLAAVSVGIVKELGSIVDLDYSEDSTAKVDMNLVMTESGKFVEIQGAGEEAPFSGEELNEMLLLGKSGIVDLIAFQKEALNDNIATEIATLENKAKTIIIATRNAGKAKEFITMFGKANYHVKTLLDFPDLPDVKETGTTFEENARIKAETISQILQCPVLADDSGLMVDALGGLPGVYSARFAGEPSSDAANNAKLLHELTDVPEPKRTGKFHCTLVFAAPKKKSLVVSGELEGRILSIPRGENGFGYDPLFYVNEKEKALAELTMEEKNSLSHRAIALKKLSSLWENWLQD